MNLSPQEIELFKGLIHTEAFWGLTFLSGAAVVGLIILCIVLRWEQTKLNYEAGENDAKRRHAKAEAYEQRKHTEREAAENRKRDVIVAGIKTDAKPPSSGDNAGVRGAVYQTADFTPLSSGPLGEA